MRLEHVAVRSIEHEQEVRPMSDSALLALGHQLEALAQAEATYYANGCATPGAEAAEEERLRAWGERLFPALAETRATTPEGWAVKLAAMRYFNEAGELTPGDRVNGAASHSEALAWAIVRDLLEARPQAGV